MYVDANGVMHIPIERTSRGPKLGGPSEVKADVIVVSIINLKDTRKAILHDPMNYTPTSIVEVFREYYTATDKKTVMTMTIQDGDSKRKLKLSYTLSTMLSRFKKQLSKLKKPESISDKLWTRFFRDLLPPDMRREKPATLSDDLWKIWLDGISLSQIEYK